MTWKNKKYGKKVRFACKRIKGYSFFKLTTDEEGTYYDTKRDKPVDFYESIQDAKKDGWVKA